MYRDLRQYVLDADRLRRRGLLLLHHAYTAGSYYLAEGGLAMFDGTRKFSLVEDNEKEMKRILTAVYDALKEKGYNPINQIVGYILSEDPTYITNYNNARSLIRKIDRDELLQELVRQYLGA